MTLKTLPVIVAVNMEEHLQEIEVMEPIRDQNGKIIEEGYRREVIEESTPWSIFKLKDGTKIQIKVLVLNVFKTAKFTSAGEPIYFVQTQNVIISKSPDSLKNPPAEEIISDVRKD